MQKTNQLPAPLNAKRTASYQNFTETTHQFRSLLVAFANIEAADVFGLPMSTTHILSSGITGTMVANGSGIQKERNIVLASVLTLPVCVLLG